MGGFAINGINMTKLESYQICRNFNATQFFVDTEGYPEDSIMQLAFEKLAFFSAKLFLIMETEERNERRHPLTKCANYPNNIPSKTIS